MSKTMGGRETETMRCVDGWLLAALLSLAVPTGCASDGFVAPDGGTTSSGGRASTGTGGSATAQPLTGVQVCAKLCKAQYAGRCQTVVITTEQCDGVCSFLEAASETCQASTKSAFECQLANDPCRTTNCNDLLRQAETDCPEKPWVTGTQ